MEEEEEEKVEEEEEEKVEEEGENVEEGGEKFIRPEVEVEEGDKLDLVTGEPGKKDKMFELLA